MSKESMRAKDALIREQEQTISEQRAEISRLNATINARKRRQVLARKRGQSRA